MFVSVPIAKEAAKSHCAIAVTHHVACVLADCNFLQQQLGLLHVTRLQSKRQHSDPQPSAGREHAGQQKESSCLYPCHQKGWDTWMWKLTFCPRALLLPGALLIHHDCFNFVLIWAAKTCQNKGMEVLYYPVLIYLYRVFTVKDSAHQEHSEKEMT